MSSPRHRPRFGPSAAAAALLAGLFATPVAVSEAASGAASPEIRCKDAAAYFAQIDGEDFCLRIFTEDGSWTAPEGLATFDLVAVGAGGGGGGGAAGGSGFSQDDAAAGGGGGGGAGVVVAALDVTPNGAVSFTIGEGGTGGSGAQNNNDTGGAGSGGGPTIANMAAAELANATGGGGGSGGSRADASIASPGATEANVGGAGGLGRLDAAGGGGASDASDVMNGGPSLSTLSELGWPLGASGSSALAGGGGGGTGCYAAGESRGTGGGRDDLTSGGDGASRGQQGGAGALGGGGGGGAGSGSCEDAKGDRLAAGDAGTSGGDGGAGVILIRYAAFPVPAPDAPTGVSATAGDGQATVSWTAPENDGGGPLVAYVVRADPGPSDCIADAPATTCDVTGLTNGTAYTFTVEAVVRVNGVNFFSDPSVASTAVTPAPVPGSPTGLSATAGDGQATVSWTAPADDGDSAITSYTATAAPGGATCTATAPATTCVVTGLTNGTAYTFTVVATNAIGDSAQSAPSTTVTPAAATTGGGTTGGTTDGGTTTGGTTDSTAGTAPREPVAATTEPVLGPDGAAPALTPGTGQVLRPGPDGPVVSTPTITTEDGQLVITDGDLTLRLSSTLPLSATGSVIAANDGTLTCEICGGVPGTTVEAWLFSSPRLVGAGVVDDEGCAELRISLAEPLDGGAAIAPGDHTLQVVIPAADTGTTPTAVNVGMTVTGPVPTSVPSGEGPAAPTGLLLIAAGIALTGATLLRREVLTTIR